MSRTPKPGVRATQNHVQTLIQLLRNLKQAPGVILEHHTFTVAALIYDEVSQGGSIEYVVGDDAVLKVFAHDAVGGAPYSPAVVVAPGLEIVAHAGDALRTLD